MAKRIRIGVASSGDIKTLWTISSRGDDLQRRRLGGEVGACGKPLRNKCSMEECPGPLFVVRKREGAVLENGVKREKRTTSKTKSTARATSG